MQVCQQFFELGLQTSYQKAQNVVEERREQRAQRGESGCREGEIVETRIKCRVETRAASTERRERTQREGETGDQRAQREESGYRGVETSEYRKDERPCTERRRE